jgi:hypothetical protein
MTRDEYNTLFHEHQLNLVAFKRLMDCDEEVLRLVNAAIAAEREACAKIFDEARGTGKIISCQQAAAAIRARGEKT